MALVDRFWTRVEKGDECWLWLGAREGEGYGKLQHDLRPRKAHRVAWELTIGPIPDGLCVLHRCDNRLCVRPDHLWLGTREENNRDRDEKGRTARGERHGSRTHPDARRGERHGRAKLTEEKVREIRRRLSAGETPGQVAVQFAVSRRSVRSIRDGHNWGWLS